MRERTSVDLPLLPANDVGSTPAPDPLVERAIALLQASPGAPWTVERLARALGCSRATLARRFAAATGTSPLAFLTLVRMHAAAKNLIGTGAGLAAIAAASGYATEFAFGRAFKRCFRISPGAFRRVLAHVPGRVAIRAVAA